MYLHSTGNKAVYLQQQATRTT